MDMDKLLEKLPELIATYAPKVIGVLVALFIAWIIAGWARSTVTKRCEKRFDPTLSRFFGNIIRYMILFGAVIGCLGVFGIETTSFAAVIGSLGLAVGLAFQGTLSNFAAGIMLLVFRPFKVDDLIVTDGETGIVEEIELFTTALKTLDNRRVIVPNSAVFGAKLQNIGHHSTRRVDIPVGCDYSADIDETRRALEGCLSDIDGMISEPAPQIFLAGLGGSSVDWEVRVWCNTADYWDVWQSTIRAVKNSLDKAEIGIPYPTMDVNVNNG